ncbi:MAG TPA: filamentous hemagglutinin N-terminal domain-containing protein, partial [Stellaceae bacterium]|nr:filamentous hemagglutinin N-terminal domain-containing protein [Stellaceae bacterium]
MRRRAQVALAAALAAGFVPGARAGGPTVGAGTATISTSGSTTTINQTSPRGVYIWPSLNLPAGNTLQFNEPTSASIAINRVTSGAAIINGSILSNGQVWIIDPAGVMFGRGSSVNVAGLIATTSDIAGGDLNFVNGTGPVTFGTPTANAAAAIVNNGSI